MKQWLVLAVVNVNMSGKKNHGLKQGTADLQGDHSCAQNSQ